MFAQWKSPKFRPSAKTDPDEPADAKVSDHCGDGNPGNPWVNSRNQKWTNATHRILVDTEARQARKADGKPAVLSHILRLLMENRTALCVDVSVDEANGTAERVQSAGMLDRAWNEWAGACRKSRPVGRMSKVIWPG